MLPPMTESGAKVVTAVVPSLRLDVLGARAFRVSRSWFAKGMASGNVSLNGSVAGHAAKAAPGDTVQAHTLGSFELLSVDGGTKKGNLKVTIKVTPA